MKILHTWIISCHSLKFIRWLGLLCLIFTHDVLAKEKIKVTHNVLHYPPYWVVKGSEVTGYHYNLAQALYREAGLQPNYVIMPYARIEAIKTEPETQIISYGSATEKSKELLFPLPATIIALYSYSLSVTPPALLEGYYEQRIAVKRGFPLGQFVSFIDDKRFHTVQLGTVDAAIQLMLFDRVDYVVTLSDPFEDAIKKYALAEGIIRKTNLIRIYGHPIAINKNNERASELYKRLNEAYVKLLSEGKIVYANNQTLLAEDYDVFINE